MTRDHDLSFDDFDEAVNPRPDTCDFDEIVEQALSRRGFLGGVLALGGFTALGGAVLPSGAKAAGDRFAFDAIAIGHVESLLEGLDRLE